MIKIIKNRCSLSLFANKFMCVVIFSFFSFFSFLETRLFLSYYLLQDASTRTN